VSAATTGDDALKAAATTRAVALTASMLLLFISAPFWNHKRKELPFQHRRIIFLRL